MTAYCNNDPCDREATHFYTTDKGARFFLCGACHDAFELGQVNSDKDTSSVDDVELTVAQINFFEAEIRNEQSGGVSPATLDSALESLEQAPDDIIVGWADDDTVNDDTVWDFVESIEDLRGDLGGDTTLDSLLPEPADGGHGDFVELEFVPQVWVNDTAMRVDPPGKATFKVPIELVRGVRHYSYDSDALRDHPNCPKWAQDWDGPFEVEIPDLDNDDETADSIAEHERAIHNNPDER